MQLENSEYYCFTSSLVHDAPKTLRDIHRIMGMSMKHNIILEMYKNAVTTLIPKDGHVPCIHRLRLIHLVEIELQAISKSQWNIKLMRKAENHNLVTDAQYGGRNNRQAQSIVLNHLLVYDLNSFQIREYTAVDEDLKANYNRELAPFGALKSRTYGASKQFGEYLVQTTASQRIWHIRRKLLVFTRQRNMGTRRGNWMGSWPMDPHEFHP